MAAGPVLVFNTSSRPQQHNATTSTILSPTMAAISQFVEEN